MKTFEWLINIRGGLTDPTFGCPTFLTIYYHFIHSSIEYDLEKKKKKLFFSPFGIVQGIYNIVIFF